ncbi:MAG: trypsin-like serine protease [Phycisphaeraceae bacterium]|nr:trypsin-like serine protease [Phycisphaerales bacterium]MCB9860100.1 trypsin-like serine protease [Phycisphaeraceae bacterium]
MNARVVGCVLGTLVISSGVLAQSTSSRFVAASVESGLAFNATNERAVVFSDIVMVPNAHWLRLDFDTAQLGAAPVGGEPTMLRITSLQDGGQIRMQAHHLEQWGYRSPYFNGDTVKIEIVADAGADPSFLSVSQVLAGQFETIDTICGSTDDRQLSNDPRVGRGWTAGGSANCTLWLINDCAKCLLAAGHCGFSNGQAHFNIPLSTSSGQVVMSAPDDQYAVDTSSGQGINGGVGNDFYYFGCFPNPNTGLTPYEAQGDAFVLGPPPTDPNTTIRVTGCGITDSTVPATYYRAQKTHTGPWVGINGTQLQYQVDTTSGNSGSPVINDNTGEAIGIHTHGGCTSGGSGANSGTSLTLPALQNAFANPQGVCAQATCCYADCDGSGSLNVFDYICFGNEYAAGTSYADCDGSGGLNVFDYICFGNEYAAGCP